MHTLRATDGLMKWLITVLFIDGIAGLSFNQPRLCPDATWTTDALSVLNSTFIGPQTIGMFIDTNNTLFVNDRSDGRVWKLTEGSATPSTIISSRLTVSAGIFVASNRDIYLDNGEYYRRVDKWSPHSNTTVPVMYVNSSCIGLFVDTNDTLYCALFYDHRIVKRSLREGINSTVTAAGDGACEKTLGKLCRPTAVFVDEKLDLYVVDSGNHRIQHFKHGQTSATTLVGSEVMGTLALYHPPSIIFEATGDLFIVERGNHSILRFMSGELHCVAACSGTNGSQTNQLNSPYSMSFDTHGNMFVLDENNRRIQKFLLARNSCVPYNQPKVCPNAAWNPDAITVANKTVVGEKPRGMFVDLSNTLYVAARQPRGILRWSHASSGLEHVVFETMPEYASMSVSINGDIYYENGDQQGRIYRWKTRTRTSESVANFNVLCYSLVVAVNNIIYCSARHANKIMSTSLNDNISSPNVVAGTGTAGSSASELRNPRGIFVDVKLNVFVADTGNGRIQLFRAGEQNGTTVAGGGVPPGLQLNNPVDVVLDGDECLYIVEQAQNRVIRSGRSGHGCIVGCGGGSGYSPSELNQPYSIRFDNGGNLYVADTDNDRIQKFLLASNSCDTQLLTTHLPGGGSARTSSYPTKEEDQTSPALSTTAQTSTTSNQPSAVSPPPSDIFNPQECGNAAGIGPNCALSKAPCVMLHPCLSNGTCFNHSTNEHDYFCSCPTDFNGTRCELDHRICKADTCFGNGNCTSTDKRAYVCSCYFGWTGDRCERKINRCHNVTCANNGVCRSTWTNYTCECLRDSYSGRHCEITANKVKVLQIVSKSFAYVAIIALAAVIMFIVVMDVLKYCFGIDPTREDLERTRRKKRERKRRPFVQRFIYVNAPAAEQRVSTIEETVV